MLRRGRILRGADAGGLLRYGTPRRTLIVLGLACVPPGLFLWDGLGTYYDLGKSGGDVDRRAFVRMGEAAGLLSRDSGQRRFRPFPCQGEVRAPSGGSVVHGPH